MRIVSRIFLTGLITGMILFPLTSCTSKTITIGFNLPLSGEGESDGIASRRAAELLKKKLNGVIHTGSETYRLRFVYEDNQSRSEMGRIAAEKLTKEHRALAVIGPQRPKQAVFAAEICEMEKTPMISPYSTNKATIRDKTFVFHTSISDGFQGTAAAIFVIRKFKVGTAAVLFNRNEDYSREIARRFKAEFERRNGPGSVRVFASFAGGTKDFSDPIRSIVASDAKVLFIPQYIDEVPRILRQAKELGWNLPIMGTESWESPELISECRSDCVGRFFITHFAAVGGRGDLGVFNSDYETAYGHMPNDVAALTWDALRLLFFAVRKTGGLSGDLTADRIKVKDGLADVRDFPGITGTISLNPSGEPEKCAVAAEIDRNGRFVFHDYICPEK